MKHENNFVLYSLASGFMLVFCMMLISDSELSSRRLVAELVSVTAFVPENHSVEYPEEAFISGRVYQDKNTSNAFDPEDQAEASVNVFLYHEDEQGLVSVIDGAVTNADGFYYFNSVPLGNYGIQLEELPDFDVFVPGPVVQGFSGARQIIPVSLEQAGRYHRDLDFIIAPRF